VYVFHLTKFVCLFVFLFFFVVATGFILGELRYSIRPANHISRQVAIPDRQTDRKTDRKTPTKT